MKTHLKATNLDITPSLSVYISRKLEAIARLIKKFDKNGGVELHVEVARTTKHHHKGPVFMAEINLSLPGKMLRAAEESADVRAAIDIVKDKLHLEIDKYKTKQTRTLRSGRRKTA